MDHLNHTEPENNTLSESLALAPAWPGMPWIHRGIRAGIATVFALVIENWLNPPGGSMMLLCVYTFTSLNALSPDESGDRPVFRQVLVFFVVMAGASILLLALTPIMASYSVLNLVIGVWAFLFGYWFHRAGGVTVPLTFAFMLLVGVVALNPQQPVGFQSIAGFFFGFMNGLVISAVAQRLMWPVLPQKNLGTGLQRYFATMIEGIDSGMASLPLWRRAEHALFPAKGKKAIALMAGPTCPPDEVLRLEEFLTTLQELSWEFSLCTGRLKPILPPEFADRGAEWIAEARGIFRLVLTELSDSIASARQPRDLGPAIDQALLEWDRWMDWLRPAIREHQTPIETSIKLMGFSSRFRAAMLVLRRANDQARGVSLCDYMGDVSL